MSKTYFTHFIRGLVLCLALWGGDGSAGILGVSPSDHECPPELALGFGGFADVSVAPFKGAVLVPFYNSRPTAVTRFVDTQVIFPDILRLHAIAIIDGRYERVKITDKFEDGEYEVTLAQPFRDAGKKARVSANKIRAYQTQRWMRPNDAADFMTRLEQAEEGGYLPPDYFDNHTPPTP